MRPEQSHGVSPRRALADAGPAHVAEGRAAAWLSLGDGRPPAALDGVACLRLAAALLAGDAADSARAGPPLRERLAALATEVPAVAAWLAARPDRGSSDPSSSDPAMAVASGPEDEASLLAGLAAGVTVVEPSSTVEPGGHLVHGIGAVEAVVLRQALDTAAGHERLRRQFSRAVFDARLDAMRELAYGAGHEINNPLANIAARAQSLLLDEADPERRRRLATIVDQSFRARDMIGGLMLFARPPKPQRGAADVGTIVAAAIDAVRGLAASRSARLEYSPPPVPLTVAIDRVQIEEAVRVVLVNAVEAVVAGGRIVLGATRRSMPGGPRCEIVVADDGRGMSSEAVQRAFDPFYSGREAGRGVGMGLPKAWRLVDSNGGTVVLESRPGHGTRVSILLPLDAAPGGETNVSEANSSG